MTWEEFLASVGLTPHTVTVQAWTGSGAYGDTFAAATSLSPCYIEDVRRAVTVQTVDAYGSEHLSSTTVFAPLDPEIKPGSLVTVPWRSRPARVLAAARLTAPGLALPEHQEINLE
ncbi:hypothetical protein [Actinoplanes italicus]|uniref:Uncharacterized protein n=1 Tax=Actinoplanes italicus TaxID=113567 RepID=A0A2T0KIW7_9ACTN|nr:hypothetical protein [Actinoplanes italicus]PRX23465.1 hypothetical protein CLV67_103213 [Actinoplanes italicus]